MEISVQKEDTDSDGGDDDEEEEEVSSWPDHSTDEMSTREWRPWQIVLTGEK